MVALELVLAATAADQVGAAATVDRVIATESVDYVVSRRASKGVVPITSVIVGCKPKQ
jgi:hypothetical protein